MKDKHKRLTFIIIGFLCLASSLALILNNFNDSLVFFYSPSELKKKKIGHDKIIRVGGLVEAGSIEKLDDGITTEFVITDLVNSTTVWYKGLLPPMFREGQGMVARGKITDDGLFIADNLLTKHDEKYMPPEVAESLKKSQLWKGAE